MYHPSHTLSPPHTLFPQTRLSEEFERCSSYLDASSRRPLIAAVEAELVGRHVGSLLDGRRGLGPLLEGHRVGDLGRLHGLVGRVGAGEALRAAFREHVRAAGLALVKDEEKVGYGVWGVGCGLRGEGAGSYAVLRGQGVVRWT